MNKKTDPTDGFTITNLQRHEHADGRFWWSAEFVAENLRVGVDDSCGSWSIYGHTEGEPLGAEPGMDGIVRRSLLTPFAMMLQSEIAGREDSTVVAKTKRR